MRIALAIALLAAAPASALDNAQVTREGERLVVSWTGNGLVKACVAERPDPPATACQPLPTAGNRLELPDDGTMRRYFVLRDGRQTVQVAERLVPLATGSNFRDVGGYPTSNGRHVRWGLIYRSGATPVLSEADMARVQGLGLATMIDLRSSEERVLAPTRIAGVPYQAVGYSMASLMNPQAPLRNGADLYRGFPAMFAPQLKLIFAGLLGRRAPLAYNCSAGQDRTGFATAMILSALGVPRSVIMQDYLLSTTYRQPANEMPKITPEQAAASPVARLFAAYQADPRAARPQPLVEADGRPFLTGAFDEIEARWGSVDAYLEREIGIGSRQRGQLRKLYTE